MAGIGLRREPARLSDPSGGGSPERAKAGFLRGKSGTDRPGLAETVGFEPTIQVSPYNGLANRRLQPLGHVSGAKVCMYPRLLRQRFILPLCEPCANIRFRVAAAFQRARRIARILAELRCAGMSARRMAAELMARSVPTPNGGQWHAARCCGLWIGCRHPTDAPRGGRAERISDRAAGRYPPGQKKRCQS